MEQVDEEHSSHKEENIGSPHSSEHDDDEAKNIEDTKPNSPEESKDISEQGRPQGDMQGDNQGIHEEGQNSGKDDDGSSKGKDQIEHVLAASPRQGAMLSSPKVTKPQTSRKKVPQIVTPNVTRALRSKGKLSKKDRKSVV